MTLTPAVDSIWFEGRAGRVARLAILSGVFIHVAGFMIFHVATEPQTGGPQPEPYVSVASSSRAAEDLVVLAALADSEPLFLPTRWNAAAPQSLAANDRMNATPFDTFSPEITLSAKVFEQKGTPVTNAPANPEAALGFEPGLVYSSFGSDRSLPVPEVSQGPRMEVFDFQSGRQALNAIVTRDALPESLPPNWRFAEFQVLVENTGQLGQPLLVTSTDVEALDQALGDYLRRRLESESLPGGYYRVVIGP